MSASDVHEKVLEQAYIHPVRNVVILDDRFRDYSLLVADLLVEGQADSTQAQRKERTGRDSLELLRAAKLWEACRDRGWTCDIEAQVPTGSRVSKILNCDLLVLDYHLVGTDPLPALTLLRKIAETKRFSLVILYTIDEDLNSVHSRVAAHLRGSRGTDQFAQEVVTAWQDIEVELDGCIDVVDIFDLFRRGNSRHQSSRLTSLVRAHVPDEGLLNEVVDVALEDYVRRTFATESPLLDVHTDISEPGNPLRWIQHGNVFVCIVSKKDHEGTEVFRRLSESLTNWAPSALHMILAYARERIAAGGLSLDSSVLHDEALRTAWVYHALGHPGDHGVKELASHLLEGVRERVTNEIADYAAALLKPERIDDQPLNELQEHKQRLSRSRSLAKSDESTADEIQVFLSLNSYLCSDAFRGTHITTGTILLDKRSGEYWLCTSPACDLVPGQKTPSLLRDELRPWLPVTLVRGKECEVKAANSPTLNRWVFLNDGTRKIILEMLTSAKVPQARSFLVANEGRVNNGRIVVIHLGGEALAAIDVEGTPSATSHAVSVPAQRLELVPVAQLRPEYGGLFLQAVGSHVGRIGVNFMSFPNSDTFPSRKPAVPPKQSTPQRRRENPPKEEDSRNAKKGQEKEDT